MSKKYDYDETSTLKAPASPATPSGKRFDLRPNQGFFKLVTQHLPDTIDVNIPPYVGTLAEAVVGKQWIEHAILPPHDVYAELGQKLAARCNEANAQQVSLYGFEYRTTDEDDSKPYYVVLYFEV